MLSLFAAGGTGTGKLNRASLFAGVGATKPVAPAGPAVVPGMWNVRVRDSRPGDATPDPDAYPLRKRPRQGQMPVLASW